ncbi:type II toxin-antitoxin system HicB family antitoxin [Ottowia sp.]|jgi:predicted HicB family RNase H-like nuclease|uniref:type II toxin-antitoxin system HicB family antitoxin n=1 Tax=Ottowia sp. TaxID=1898956 RepID=UPI0025E181CB|nr:type II toxin-antitoxin system HicB family antitoxin [Ottowia sp.]MBK6745330.1 type II toxin-antitoxin system HicB family antitoxin [Ottowia sp.]
MSKMIHKGYTAHIQYDDRDGIFVGRVLGIVDIIGFHADTAADLRAAFHDAVDDYLESCKRLGKEPQTAASGKMMLRVNPEVHRAALIAAQAEGTSLNRWVERVLGEAARVH